ncbi:ATPase components of ABC transporters with duplicated ATPase domains [Serpentinimonas raichei]|uniref:ATP-binding protein Uup n=1 Tax=Serpentinimonas raichei TaxID=1458425 RepID=A0A060NKT6_9BURK|nr:ATP-binding cassette domain-containing protein [Serpentinimonas raichei]BAO81935.1 ATPase components of ABC transporters with duplicated ATPase domains [Serpentinimonas raichei]
MTWITLTGLSLAYGHLPLLNRVDFSLQAGERVGLVGRNGSGKSSLLKIIAGLERPDDGAVQRQNGLRLAYVPQEPDLDPEASVFEAVSVGLQRVQQLVQRYLAHEPGCDLDALQSEIETLDGWNWEQRVEQTLSRLGLQADERVGSLSGGVRKRVALAQALVALPDLLLLDEPTNHLDLDAIGWLAELLREFRGTLLLISHDRDFLDRVCTRIVELDRGQLHSYDGAFSAFERQKAQRLAQEALLNARADKLLAQEEQWIRKGVEARRTRAQARIERLHSLRAEHAQRRAAVGQVRLDVNSGQGSGRLVAELEGVCKSFGEGPERRCIIDNFSATILRGDKVGLIGPNGAGKTTLLKLILGQLAPDSGSVRSGSRIEVAYFDQMRDALDLNATLEDFISPGSEWIEIGTRRIHVRSYLADFLFAPARARAPISALSGGERNRLLLARLFARPANVLVLDEPTNDLDIETLELLEQLLTEFDGTVFLVSHDRRFLDNVVTSTIVFEGAGQWREYEGGVEDWIAQSMRVHGAAPVWGKRSEGAASLPGAALAAGTGQARGGATANAASSSAAPSAGSPAPSPAPASSAPQPTATPAAAKRKLSYKEQRELEALPQRIEALEAEQKAIAAELGDGLLFARHPERASALTQRHAVIEDELLQALERWEALGQPG